MIPQDIINNIIEALDNDDRLLRKCALVSSSFLLPCRKRLFSSLSLTNNQACPRLYQFLVENPVVQSFVKSMTITSDWGYRASGFPLSNWTSLVAILRLTFCCLESFSIYMGNTSNWNDFSSEVRDALSTIIHSSTLQTLDLTGVNVPIAFFQGIHLAKLVLNTLWLNGLDGKQPSFLTPAALEGEATASHTVLEECEWNFFSPVHGTRFSTSLYLSFIWDMEGLTKPIFLPFMCRLRVFKIFISLFSTTWRNFSILSFLMRSLRVSLTSPATLEHLQLDIEFIGNNNFFPCHALFRNLRNDDVWSHLDSIITHPTGSRLQRVDINIEYHFRYDDDVIEPDETEVIKPVLDALPLLREKGILFVKATLRS